MLLPSGSERVTSLSTRAYLSDRDAYLKSIEQSNGRKENRDDQFRLSMEGMRQDVSLILQNGGGRVVRDDTRIGEVLKDRAEKHRCGKSVGDREEALTGHRCAVRHYESTYVALDYRMRDVIEVFEQENMESINGWISKERCEVQSIQVSEDSVSIDVRSGEFSEGGQHEWRGWNMEMVGSHWTFFTELVAIIILLVASSSFLFSSFGLDLFSFGVRFRESTEIIDLIYFRWRVGKVLSQSGKHFMVHMGCIEFQKDILYTGGDLLGLRRDAESLDMSADRVHLGASIG
ncbi:hypothetical protein Tco_0088816 [Tanacetum coccineum]